MSKKSTAGGFVDRFSQLPPSIRKLIAVAALFLLAAPIFYSKFYLPTEIYWDESYHISSAAKYLNGVFFMEPHPPLGKLFLAAGEKLLNLNDGQTFGFEKTGFIDSRQIPVGFSFAGYRFFPTIFGLFNVVLIFLLLCELLKDLRWALAFSSVYLFESSIIAHSRQASLDPFLIFGVLVCLLGFFPLYTKNANQKTTPPWILYLVMGIGFSISVMTKAFGWALLILWPLLLWKKLAGNKKEVLRGIGLQSGVFVVFFVTVWQTHFSMSSRVEPTLYMNGYYHASNEYKKILNGEDGSGGKLSNFFLMLGDHLTYAKVYQERQSPYDLDKGDQTASFPIMWPFGSRPIIYLWNFDKNSSTGKYLYFIPNPWNWLLALLGLVCAMGYFFISSLGGIKVLSRNAEEVLQVLLVLYFAFWIPLFFVRRKLYMTHYLVPYLLSAIIVSLLLVELVSLRKRSSNLAKFTPYFFSTLSLGAFLYFKPLVYFEPLSCEQANNRAVFRFWNLKFPGCPDAASPAEFIPK